MKIGLSINRMIIPEGSVPRFCMGSVETDGPDSVDSHEHPMLDQLFLGLKNCNCTCYANNEQVFLTENMMLHIPLGSMHSVSVADEDKLFYIWFDFFLTIEGQTTIEDSYIYKGIASRKFKKVFPLAESADVVSASLKNGLLEVNIEVTIPEDKKPKLINISID